MAGLERPGGFPVYLLFYYVTLLNTGRIRIRSALVSLFIFNGVYGINIFFASHQKHHIV